MKTTFVICYLDVSTHPCSVRNVFVVFVYSVASLPLSLSLLVAIHVFIMHLPRTIAYALCECTSDICTCTSTLTRAHLPIRFCYSETNSCSCYRKFSERMNINAVFILCICVFKYTMISRMPISVLLRRASGEWWNIEHCVLSVCVPVWRLTGTYLIETKLSEIERTFSVL